MSDDYTDLDLSDLERNYASLRREYDDLFDQASSYKQRAEQAEERYEGLRETRRQEIRATEQWKERAEKAEADAARFKRTLQRIAGICSPEIRHWGVTMAREELERSAPPASEAEDVREQTCRHWGTWRTVGDCMADGDCHEGCPQAQHLEQAPDPAPADRPECVCHYRPPANCPVHQGMKDPEPSEALKAIEKAQAKLAAVCRGDERWTMSVPARPDSDPDLVISDALEKAKRSLSQPVPPVPDPSEAEAELRRLVEWAMMVMPNYTRHHEAVRESSERIRRALASAQPAVPEGYKVVPLEPTEAMLRAVKIDEWGDRGEFYHWMKMRGDRLVMQYRAMTAAAPTEPAVGDQT